MPEDDGVMISDDALRSDSVVAIVGAGVLVIPEGNGVGLSVLTPEGKYRGSAGDSNGMLTISVGTGVVLLVILPTGNWDGANAGPGIFVTSEGEGVGLPDRCLVGLVI